MPEWSQPSLPSMAVENVVITATYEGRDGWKLRVAARRQFEEWSDTQPAVYRDLSPGELVDVVFAEVWCLMGRPDDGL